MNLTSFDPCKPVETRAGKPATITRTDLKSPLYPIGATFFDQSDEEMQSVFTKDGRYSNDVIDSPNDLINVGGRLKVTCWLNVTPTGRVYAFPTKEAADGQASFVQRVACVECNIDVPTT